MPSMVPTSVPQFGVVESPRFNTVLYLPTQMELGHQRQKDNEQKQQQTHTKGTEEGVVTAEGRE